MDLETLLFELAKRGELHLHKMGRGWYCRLEIKVIVGAECEIKSEMDCATPLDALVQAHTRLFEFLDEMSKAVVRV